MRTILIIWAAFSLGCTGFDSADDPGLVAPEEADPMVADRHQDGPTGTQDAASQPLALDAAPTARLTGADYWNRGRTSDLVAIDRELKDLGDPWKYGPGDPRFVEVVFRSASLHHERRILTHSQADAKLVLEMINRLTSQPGHENIPGADNMLFLQALAFRFLGRDSDMNRSLMQVIQLYPQSRLVAFVYLVYAEDLYATKRYDLAERYYKKVAQFRDSEAYAYALFQLGHCKMQPLGSNQPEYKEALRYYHQAIQATMFGTGGGPKNLAVRLRRQARLALVPAFVNIGKPSKAHAFFAKIGRGPQTEDETVTMMEALARSYLDAGMVVESTYIYKQLLSRHSQHPDACGWASQIYDNAHRLGSKSLIEGEGREVRNFAQEPRRRDDPQCARLVDEPM